MKNNTTNGVNIRVNDIGPVVEFDYELSGHGLHILRGHQGAGKTTILRTVQLASDGRTDVRPTKRDGAKEGAADVAGKSIRIKKQVREEGDISVDGLGDLDIAGLHTPKFVDAKTRDRHRIKALVRLAGVAADPSLFHELTGGRENFDRLIDPSVLETDDLVEMAARVKRSIEKEAQRIEAQAATAQANAQAKQSQIGGVDMTAPDDADALQAEYDEAVTRRAVLIQQRTSALEVINRATMAREKLDALPKGTTIAEAQIELDEAEAGVKKCEQDRQAKADHVAELERQLEQAYSDLNAAADRKASAETFRDAAAAALESAKRNDTLSVQLREQIEAAENVECPDQDVIDEAEATVIAARDAVNLGVKVRQAKAAEAEASKYREQVKQYTVEARRLRDSAKDTLDVLSEAIGRIPACPLRVNMDDDGNPRVVLETDRSEAEPFDELSDGERWPIIIGLAAAKNRLIVLPQAAFGELSPETRRQLHELAQAHGCYILTAQSDDGELRGEMYQAEREPVAA